MADTISISDLGYKPTEWKNGDIITSEKLNKLENATGFFVIEPESEEGSLTGIKASYNDILHAFSQGKLPIVININSDTNMSGVSLGFITDIFTLLDSETGSSAYGGLLVFFSSSKTENLIAEDPDANLGIYTPPQ